MRRPIQVSSARPLPARIRQTAAFACGVALAVDWIGAVLVWVGVFPAALGSLHVPLLLTAAAAAGVWALADAVSVFGEPLPMRCLRASLTIGGAVCFAAMVAASAGLWTGQQARRAMILMVGLAGAALVGDAVRDARKRNHPRFAVLACSCGGVGMMMLSAWMLPFRYHTGVRNRMLLMAAGLGVAAGVALLKVRPVRRRRARLLSGKEWIDD